MLYSRGQLKKQRPWEESIRVPFLLRCPDALKVRAREVGAPINTPCMSFDQGEIAYFGYNPSEGDYGHVVVTKHELQGKPLWALYGHLSSRSILGKRKGQKIDRGEIVGWIGGKEENGGWEPHLHFQLSWSDPMTHDMPGVVDPKDRSDALARYPDPRIVLGPIY